LFGSYRKAKYRFQLTQAKHFPKHIICTLYPRTIIFRHSIARSKGGSSQKMLYISMKIVLEYRSRLLVEGPSMSESLLNGTPSQEGVAEGRYRKKQACRGGLLGV